MQYKFELQQIVDNSNEPCHVKDTEFSILLWLKLHTILLRPVHRSLKANNLSPFIDDTEEKPLRKTSCKLKIRVKDQRYKVIFRLYFKFIFKPTHSLV